MSEALSERDRLITRIREKKERESLIAQINAKKADTQAPPRELPQGEGPVQPQSMMQEQGLPAPQGGVEWGAELGRAVTRGTQNMFEFGQDIVDIPFQAGKAAIYPEQGETPLGAAGRAAFEQINPFGEDSEIDKLRQQYMYDPMQDITEQQYAHPVITGVEHATEAGFAPGKVLTNAVIAAGTGLGAGTGESLGGETGEIVGAITGGLVSPAKTIAKYANKIFGEGRNKKVDKAVIDFIRENAEDADKAIATFTRNMEAGNRGTVADLAEDPRLFNLEAVVPKGTRESDLLQQQQLAGQQQTIEELSGGFGTGDTRAATRTAQQNVDVNLQNIEAQKTRQLQNIEAREVAELGVIDQKTKALQKQADDAERFAEGIQDSPEASITAAQDWNRLDTHLTETYVRPAWQKFDEASKPLDGVAVYDDVNEILEAGLNNTQRKLLRDEHNDVFKLIENWTEVTEDGARVGKPTQPSEVHTVIQKINDKFRIAENSKSVDATLRNLKSVATHLDEYLRKLPKNKKAGQAYDTAMKASHNRFERVTRGRTGKARAKEDEAFGKTIFASGDVGKRSATDLKKALADGNDPETQAMAEQAIESVQNYVRAQANIPGRVNERFMRNYKPFLDEFPDLQKQLQESVGAGTTLKKATKEKDAGITKLVRAFERERGVAEQKATRLTKATERSTLSSFAKEPTKTVSKIIKQQDNAQRDLEYLMSNVQDKEGFARVVGDSVVKDLATDVLGGKGIDHTAMNKWDDIRPVLEGSIEPSQLKQIDTAVARTRSSVARRMSASQKVESASRMVGDMVTNLTSAVIASNLPGGHSLIYGGRIRGWLNSMRGKQTGNEKALIKAISDPEEFAKLIATELPENQDQFNRLWQTYVQAQQGGPNDGER